MWDSTRFWSKVGAADENGCWPWTGLRNEGGYGRFGNGSSGTRYAHRIAYMLENGPVPEGLLIMHKCDNRACCNPFHLSVGTPADNMNDMIAKGRDRKAFGESHCRSKLTTAQVTEIRAASARGELQADIAARYGITQPAVSEIVRRKKWKQVA